MQIDSRNFQEHVDLILQQIESAHFIAFDCEFSGLATQSTQIEGLFADHQEFYERIKQTALNFNLIQLGVTLFQFNNGEYFPRSYNFFTSVTNKQNCNKLILSQWESLAFLARNGMDFGRVFKYGINFKRLYENHKEQAVQYVQGREPKIYYGPNDKNTIAEIEKLIEKQKQLRVDFQTKRIFDYFRTKYDMSFDKPKNSVKRYEYNIKIYPQHEIQFIQQKKSQQTSLLQNIEDISLVDKVQSNHLTLEVIIGKIIECGKPIVGHFPNLDLGLIYHSFIAELPNTYEQFSYQINKLFPYIYDTKVLSRRLQNKMKNIKVDLKSLFKSCFNQKLLQPFTNVNYKFVQEYVKTESSHEAGYDSFMTGCAFIGMLNYLYDQKQTAFVFAVASAENKILYSKFAGEISLVGPVFSSKTEEYNRRIVILQTGKNVSAWQKIGDQLSNFGTIEVHQDHGETYYLFDEDQNIAEILNTIKELKAYKDRSIIRNRSYFK